jgi:hypothetical protein
MSIWLTVRYDTGHRNECTRSPVMLLDNAIGAGRDGEFGDRGQDP